MGGRGIWGFRRGDSSPCFVKSVGGLEELLCCGRDEPARRLGMREVYEVVSSTMERTREFGIYSRILVLPARVYYLFTYQHGRLERLTKDRTSPRSKHEFDKYMAPNGKMR